MFFLTQEYNLKLVVINYSVGTVTYSGYMRENMLDNYTWLCDQDCGCFPHIHTKIDKNI